MFNKHKLTGAVLPFNRVRLANGQTTYVRGLTKTIKSTFCPMSKKPKRGNSSKAIGLRVHKQVELWANGKTPKRLHPYAASMIKFLKKYEVVAAELPLLSVKGHFLTRFDLLCKNSRGLILVSLKTGGNRMFKSGKHLCKLIPSQKDSVYVQHQLQVALERQCLEEEYGIKIHRSLVLYAGFGVKKELRKEWQAPWTRDLDLLAQIEKSSNVKKLIV